MNKRDKRDHHAPTACLPIPIVIGMPLVLGSGEVSNVHFSKLHAPYFPSLSRVHPSSDPS